MESHTRGTPALHRWIPTVGRRRGPPAPPRLSAANGKPLALGRFRDWPSPLRAKQLCRPSKP
eukprot:7251459-Alexandrium_andersonii.AAC.1